jgi:thiol:disulfide interchange protein DsbD
VLGGTALFALSLGMGTPVLIVGTSGGPLLPKVGPWMTPINAVFGVMLLLTSWVRRHGFVVASETQHRIG